MPDVPAIREGDDYIEIDQSKGSWPFVKFVRGDKDRLLMLIDSNEGGQIIGEGQGIAMLVISKKKAKALKEFLERTEGLGT